MLESYQPSVVVGKIVGMRSRVGVAVLMCAGLGAGCAAILGFEDTSLQGEVLPADGGDGAVPEEAGEAGAPSLSISPSALIIRRGKSATVEVTVVRGSDAIAGVGVQVQNLPPGLSAPPMTLDPAATKATLTISATKTASLGKASVRVLTDIANLAAASVDVLVADEPGTLDQTFGPAGFIVDNARGPSATFYALGTDATGRILAGGALVGAAPQGSGGWFLERFSALGEVDTAFRTAAAGLPANGELRAIAIDKAGKIVCVGTSTDIGPPQLTVVRLNPEGTIDPSFNGGTVRFSATDGALGTNGYAVAIQDDGMIVVAGAKQDGVTESGILARLTATGMRDATFNGNAPVVLAQNHFVGVAVDAQGRLLVAGTDTTNPLTSYFLMRRTPQGAFDTTFGNAGVLAFGLGFRANAFVRMDGGALAVMGDSTQTGALYTGGTGSADGGQIWARGLANGQGASYYGVATDNSGRLLAAGHTVGANPEARVDRVLADGNYDGVFGDGGTSFVEPADLANGIDVTLFASSVQSDGRILVGGNRSTGGAVVYRLWQ